MVPGPGAPGVPEPGPAPVAPRLPWAELRALAAALDDLLDELDRVRLRREAALHDALSRERFVGAAGDDLRDELGGQLRRSRHLRDRLTEDREEVARLLAAAAALEQRHADDLAAWRLARAAWAADQHRRYDPASGLPRVWVERDLFRPTHVEAAASPGGHR
jgi:hypothetical protein